MLDSALLRDFCATFYGYGEERARDWFISMEEGGGNSQEELELRVNAWRERGRRDVAEYHKAIEQER